MGAVHRQTYNVQLMEQSCYANKRSIKNLIRSFPLLEQLAESGDSVAHSILIDLKEAILSECVTPTQRAYIVEYLIEGYNFYELADKYNLVPSTVKRAFDKGIGQIVERLRGDEIL